MKYILKQIQDDGKTREIELPPISYIQAAIKRMSDPSKNKKSEMYKQLIRDYYDGKYGSLSLKCVCEKIGYNYQSIRNTKHEMKKENLCVRIK